MVGQPVMARLVDLKIKPWPGENQKNIAPYLDVTFAACKLSTDVDVILSENVISRLAELEAYSVPEPIENKKCNRCFIC